jgi:hypothetical protein
MAFEAVPPPAAAAPGKTVLHQLSFKRFVDASSAELRARLVSGAVLDRLFVTFAKKVGNVFRPTLVLTSSQSR